MLTDDLMLSYVCALPMKLYFSVIYALTFVYNVASVRKIK